MNLVIDIGNTLVKYGLFQGDDILDIYKKKEEDILFIDELIDKFDVDSIIISSVREMKNWKFKVNHYILDHRTKIPINIRYKTPKTLGNDRIANIIAASILYPYKNILVIDAGSCITYDFINKNKDYFGGRISPGIKMRYKSLNMFTDLLPLIDISGESLFMGDDTKSSIISGVEQGVLAEVNSIISELTKENQELVVIVTGGDTFFFEMNLKKIIFADQNLVLKGLNEILKYNE